MTTNDEFRAALRRKLGPVGVWRPSSRPAAEERASAQEFERLGYGSIWFGEGPTSKETFVESGILLAATERIVVATGIANIYVRDAVAMKGGAYALGEAYPGRFLLGLGVSHALLVESRGHTYGAPVTEMRAYLDAMERAGYTPPPPPEPVPYVLAALRPRMLGLARDRTAGAHPYHAPPEHTARARKVLGPGPLLIPEQPVVLERDAGRARTLARQHMARYLAMPNYCNNYRDLGFEERDLAEGGSDRLIDAIFAWGDADTIVARVRQHLDAGADHVPIQPITAESAQAVEVMRTLAPLLLKGR